MDLFELSQAIRPFWVVWLMIFFAGIMFWVFRPANKERFEQDGMIPLRDDEKGE